MTGLNATERERVTLAIPSVVARVPDVERVIGVVEQIVARRLADHEAQIRDLLEEREELLTEIVRLQRGNHPAGRALPHLALAEALTERDAEHIREVNLRVLKHEAETPMRGHDADGECCRRARLGETP